MPQEFTITGIVDEAGRPAVHFQLGPLITFTLPLRESDSLARYIRQAGTRAVLKVGAAREASTAPSVNGQCLSDPAADLAALEAQSAAMFDRAAQLAPLHNRNDTDNRIDPNDPANSDNPV